MLLLKPKKVFSPSLLAQERMNLIEKKFNLLPDDVQPEGYYYDGPKALTKLLNKKKMVSKKA